MAADPEPKPRRVSDGEIDETILALCRAEGLEGRIRPEDVAMTILPNYWQTLTKRVRLASRRDPAQGRAGAGRRQGDALPW